MDTKPIGLSGEDQWKHTCEFVTFSPQLEIQRMCLQSYPCQHHVKINGIYKLLRGDEIYRYCIENSIPFKDNHFTHYAEWCRTHPPRQQYQTIPNNNIVINGNSTMEDLDKLFDKIFSGFQN